MFYIPTIGATLAIRKAFSERQPVSQPSPHNQATSQRDISSPEVTADGTHAVQSPLLASPDSGMIVFSSSGRILHMNGQARMLMAIFGKSHELWPQMAPESMPSILTEFCYDVLAQLQRQIEARDWTQFEMRRVCHMVTPSLLFTGFGVPDSTNRELRVILTLTPLPSLPRPAADAQYLHEPYEVFAPIGGA